uniref:SFRICE_041042 n=1 Tax=Spodoptera frugiperda TaxID=7108 RepID=A0A2H1WXI8_SPOFR
MKAQVRHENELSTEIDISSGVKQGCVMAPTLFAIYFSIVLRDALQYCSDQIQINFRTDKGVFDVSRFKAKSKSQTLSILEILYADDVCLMSDSMANLQSYVDALHQSCQRFGLVISASKTQILKQPARGCVADGSILHLGGKPLEEVTHFKYLGSNIRHDNTLATEIPSRIANAAANFGRLNARVWRSHDLRLETKISVYKALILPVLLYGAETWCLYKSDIRKLDTFHLRCLRSILNIKWMDRIPNTEVLRRAAIHGMDALLMRRQLGWCGHILRMKENRLPKKVFYSEMLEGKRKHGGQHLRYKDVLKRHLNACGINTKEWERLATHRQSWRIAVNENIKAYEHQRLDTLDVKRQLRKDRPKPSYIYTYNAAGQLYCYNCDRIFKTKFGLASHIRAHDRK